MQLQRSLQRCLAPLLAALQSAPSWPPPPLVKTPLPDPRRLAAVEDVHTLDLKRELLCLLRRRSG